MNYESEVMVLGFDKHKNVYNIHSLENSNSKSLGTFDRKIMVGIHGGSLHRSMLLSLVAFQNVAFYFHEVNFVNHSCANIF